MAIDEKAFVKASEAVTDFRSKHGAHFSWEHFQLFIEVYEAAKEEIYEYPKGYGPGDPMSSYPKEVPEQPVFSEVLEDVQAIRNVAGDLDIGLLDKMTRMRGNIGGIVTRACDRIEEALKCK